MSIEIAKDAGSISQSTNIQRKDFALENVDIVGIGIKSIKKLDKKEDVYCIATQDGNFVANGMIIKNCDALRYAIYTHKPQNTKWTTEQEPEVYRDRRHPGGSKWI
ncbi:MAG: hypothetical protein KGI50_05390 [Patescibacteria group bacterium]|nr:hypothetical protein [Patescibacteria group bacterium]MDE2438761.1 hypothetical protein [Patescibacteria group bacterium]